MKAFKETSTSSQFLNERERINSERSNFDFEGWFRKTIRELGNKPHILDIFCGRGKQLKELKNIWPNSNITGVDIAQESIAYIKNQYQGIDAICQSVEDFILSSNKSGRSWDLVTAFYGLYYAKNQPDFISNIANIINKNGHVIICGPYGKNNSQLYELLAPYQQIDSFILHTSVDYMDSVVIPEFKKNGFDIHVDNKVNTISYNNVEEVIKYLNSTTFFDRENIVEVKRDLEGHFNSNSVFAVDKHIKMIVCEKL